MLFTPYIFSIDGEPLPVVIDSATASDFKVTSESPVWQTDWTSDYLSAPGIEKYAMKTLSGELVALAAYQTPERKLTSISFILRAPLTVIRQ